jgi:hypothetical protein
MAAPTFTVLLFFVVLSNVTYLERERERERERGKALFHRIRKSRQGEHDTVTQHTRIYKLGIAMDFSGYL